MTEYRVRWEIDLGADSAEGAAATAFEWQHGDEGMFTVQPADDPIGARWELISVNHGVAAMPDEVVWEYNHKALFEMARKMVADGGDVDAVLEMLERPWKWPELLTAAVLDSAFDAVSPGEDVPDTSDDPAPVRTCKFCGVEVTVDDVGPMSSGYWMDSTHNVHCPKPSPSGCHEVDIP